MKRKIFIFIAIALLLILFVPIPTGVYKDGGTRTYSAVAYKIIAWRRITFDEQLYEKTRVYFGADRYKSSDQLWLDEAREIEHELVCTIKEINDSSVTVEPCRGEPEEHYSLSIEVNTEGLPKIDLQVGDVVQIKYKGDVLWSSPAKINAFDWKKRVEASAKRSEFLKKAEEIEAYSRARFETALTQLEMNTESYNVYEKWEALLDEICGYLGTSMSDEEFSILETEQEKLLCERENAIEAEAEKWENGSGEPLARSTVAIQYTKDWCYYLISYIK